MSLLLDKVSRIGKLVFLRFNAVNILIYCNNQEGIKPLFTEINKLVNEKILFNKLLDLIEQHTKKMVVLNKNDIEIINKNAENSLNSQVLADDSTNFSKYIFVST